MENKRTCPFCESHEIEEKSTISRLEIEGQYYDVDTFYCECKNCGSDFSENIETKKNSRAIIAMRKRALDLLSGSDIKSIREKYQISIKQADQLFGGGPVAFSKYENDDLCQGAQLDTLLKLAKEDSSIIDRIIKMKRLESEFYTQSKNITKTTSYTFSENETSNAYYDPKVYRNLSDKEERKNNGF